MTISRKRAAEIAAIADEDIDYSDIPETDAAFWARATLVEPERTQPSQKSENRTRRRGKKGCLGGGGGRE